MINWNSLKNSRRERTQKYIPRVEEKQQDAYV
jgi:hypothetical protein